MLKICSNLPCDSTTVAVLVVLDIAHVNKRLGKALHVGNCWLFPDDDNAIAKDVKK